MLDRSLIRTILSHIVPASRLRLSLLERMPREMFSVSIFFCISTMSMAIVYCSLVSASSAALSSSFEGVPVQSLVEEDGVRNRSVRAIASAPCVARRATGSSPVSVCKDALHVGQLLLFDRAALQDALFVVFVQRVEAVEQREEFRFLVSGQTGGIELEVPLFGFTHAPNQFEYRFQYLQCHLFGCFDLSKNT